VDEKLKQLEPGMFVAGQIWPEEVPALAARGIALIVNNRPDDEAPGQPSGALWALARSLDGETGDTLFERAAAAGYDLAPIRRFLR